MSYYIDIIDTTSPLTQLVLENASASGIVLKWNGGDTKDEMAIVSSEFNFDMLTRTAEDAAFVSFFTGDEHRYKVLVKSDADDSIIWQGYILPDLYSEPYKNVTFFVSFTATDGLGRLKGKYLADEYYSREKSVIDIFCQCLKLTGIELDLYFNPAIENFIEKSWKSIYIDGTTFLDKEKKQDAYKILETLLKDTLSVCYQADNRWYIEGINTRHVREVVYKIYDTNGNFTGTSVYNRLLKNITALVTPVVTIIPPYNEITITHNKIEPSLPATLSKEVNDGWAVVTGVIPIINASGWMAHNEYHVLCTKPDYYATFFSTGYFTGNWSATYAHNDLMFASLKEKKFFSKGQKVKLNLGFKVALIDEYFLTELDPDLWINPLKYEILYNDVVIFSNWKVDATTQEKLVFDTSTNQAEITFDYIFTADGLFDIKIWQPFGKVRENRIMGIELRKLTVEVIDFIDEEIITDLINGEFTVDKDIELTYSDDKSGTSNGFRLARLKEQTSFYNEIEVPILYAFSLDGKKYSVVQLDGANLIDENRYVVYYEGVLVNILNVYYNFNNGEQMVIETEIVFDSGAFSVKKYAIDDVIESRSHWLQWTDAIYKIENTSYSKTVANIFRRMFNEAHEKFDCTVLNAVKFNDIILFKYSYMKDFIVTNCSWNLDDNKTTITVGRSHYKDAGSTIPGDDNIPPIVLAGEDIYLTNEQTTASAIATAYDPDGYINAQVWTKTVGGFGDIIETPFALATDFQNLTEDYYMYQIQVTDNEGATAVDSLNIIRIKDYILSLVLVSETIDSTTDYNKLDRRYRLEIAPDLLPGMTLKLQGLIILSTNIVGPAAVLPEAFYSIEKNGAIIESNTIYHINTLYMALEMNVIATDTVYFDFKTYVYPDDPGSGSYATSESSLAINTAEFIAGVGVVTNLPIEVSQDVIIYSKP